MTDYYYQADRDDLPEDERDPRPSEADRYPADRDFFLGRGPIDALAPYDDEDDEIIDLEPIAQIAPPDPVEDDYTEDDYAYEAESGYYDAPYPEAEEDFDEPDVDEASYAVAEDAPEPDPAPVVPPAGQAKRMSVAEAGAASDRRIRFDPTKQRGAEYYERARSHSKLVRRLKFVLPGIAGLGILAFLGFMQFAPSPGDAIITLSGINVESKSITMEKPHISGFEGTRQAYEVTAEKAVQDLDNAKVMTLHGIKASVGMGDGETANIVAATGRYDDTVKQLTLSGGITLETTSGYRARLDEAVIEVEGNVMSSSRPLEIETQDGVVKANGVTIRENGKHIVFRDGVNVVYAPPKGAVAGPAVATPANEAGAPRAQAAAGGAS